MKKIVHEIKMALLLLQDPKRQKFAESYYPTTLQVIGVTVPNVKLVLREIQNAYRHFTPEQWFELAYALIDKQVFECSQLAMELFNNNKILLSNLTENVVVQLDKNLDNWVLVDSYAAFVLGVAWRQGVIDDKYIHQLVNSSDKWNRRKALAATIALNQKARGGKGDVDRTIAVCEKLAIDHQDMVVKALSWALRVLIGIDRNAVMDFLDTHQQTLHKRIIREVRSKLSSGLKNLN